MRIQDLRGYGIAPSDAEGSWDPAFKGKLKRKAQNVVMRNLTFMQKLRFSIAFISEKWRAGKLDLTDLREKGMRNQAFLDQQLEYLAVFASLKKVRGKDAALTIMHQVMDATAAEALLLTLPEPEDICKVGDPFEVFRQICGILPEVTKAAGCHSIAITEDTEKAIQWDVSWCVWLELAKKMGVAEACIPNCYADDLAYPDYFKAIGIEYKRAGTLAMGAKQCDFRFVKIERASGG